MERLPITFAGTLEEIDKWHNQWSIETFGVECGPDRYYKTTPDGRYLYGVREGEAINDEKDQRERVLEKLCRLRIINRKLSGVGLNYHLKPEERERLKNERESVYKDYCTLIGPDGLDEYRKSQNEKNCNSQNKPTEPFVPDSGKVIQTDKIKASEGKKTADNGTLELPAGIDTPEAKRVFERAITEGYIVWNGNNYNWNKDKANRQAAAYLCEKIYCPNPSDKNPNWGLIEQFLGLKRLDQAVRQNYNVKKPQKWITEIDRLLQD